MGIVDRIVAGTATWADIFEHNIKVMETQITRERNNKHNPNDCTRKYCKHGTKRAVQELINHRDKLVKELQVIRAGVAPTDVR